MIKIYFNLVDGRLNGYSFYDNGHEYSAEVPEGHEVINNPDIFKYENGELVKDEEYQRQLSEEEQSQVTDEQMNAIALMELTEIIMGGK